MALSRAQIESLEYIPNEPLRKRVVLLVADGKYTYTQIAEGAGITRILREGGRTRITGDTATLRRKLGLQRQHKTKGMSQYIAYDVALGIVRFLRIDPVDVGV